MARKRLGMGEREKWRKLSYWAGRQKGLRVRTGSNIGRTSIINVQSSFGGVNWFSVNGLKMKGMRSGTGEYWVADIK